MACDRHPFNGQDWPRDSPVARVYDVGNSSTSLVLLNRRRKKKSQLRGLTHRNGEILTPDPQRHVPEEPSVNLHYHKKCLNSSSEPFRPRVSLNLGWINATQRPPVRFDGGTHVNHQRHTSCRVSRDSPVVAWTAIPRRPMTGTSYGVDSELQSVSPMLNDPDISQGGRKYLYSIARIYSTSQMKQLKQDQYQQLLIKELSKGYHSPKEYERYLNYLNTPRKTQFGKLDSYEETRRSKSAPPPTHGDDSGREGESDKGKRQKRTLFGSCSWTPSVVSSSSRPSTRQRGGKKRTGSKSQSLPTCGAKTAEDTQSRDTHRQSSEPLPPTSTSEEDPSNHTRKEESEAGDEPLAGIRESKEDSYKSKEKTARSDTTTTTTQKETELTPVPLTMIDDEVGVFPQKEDPGQNQGKDMLSPRKGKDAQTHRKDDMDEQVSEGREKQSSEVAATTTTTDVAPTSSNTNTTSNNLLALIISDAEKDDHSKTVDNSEQEKQYSAEETAASQPGMARDFSDTQIATGHTPRMNKEGCTRPLSRAGRVTEQGKDKENSGDDYNDTDEEMERADVQTTKDKEESPQPQQHLQLQQQQQQQQEQQQQQKQEQEEEEEPVLEPETPAIDTSRTEDSKTEGDMEEEQTTVMDKDKRADSPDEGQDERVQDSRETEGPHLLIIPIADQPEDTSAAKADVLDLSAESKNRDVDKLEY